MEVERYHQPARYRKRKEYIPTRDEIMKMSYAAGSKLDKALILAAYTSGLRNSTLRALRYRDLSARDLVVSLSRKAWSRKRHGFTEIIVVVGYTVTFCACYF